MVPSSQTFVLKTGLLADGSGAAAKSGHAVAVADGYIKAVGPAGEIASQAAPETETIDLGSACLTPGLIDGHTHLGLPGTAAPTETASAKAMR